MKTNNPKTTSPDPHVDQFLTAVGRLSLVHLIKMDPAMVRDISSQAGLPDANLQDNVLHHSLRNRIIFLPPISEQVNLPIHIPGSGYFPRCTISRKPSAYLDPFQDRPCRIDLCPEGAGRIQSW